MKTRIMLLNKKDYMAVLNTSRSVTLNWFSPVKKVVFLSSPSGFEKQPPKLGLQIKSPEPLERTSRSVHIVEANLGPRSFPNSIRPLRSGLTGILMGSLLEGLRVKTEMTGYLAR